MFAPKPSRLLENAIWVPSGDHTGDEAVARSRVSQCERPLAASMTYRSVMPARPVTYAIRDCATGFAVVATSVEAASERMVGAAVGWTSAHANRAVQPAASGKLVVMRRHVVRRWGRTERDVRAWIRVMEDAL